MGYFDDQEQAAPGALENALMQRRRIMEAMSKRNLAAVRGAGAQTPMGPRAAAILAQMNGPQGGPSMASIPDVPPPAAAAYGRHGDGASGLTTGTLDPAIAERIKDQFKERAMREQTKGAASQGEQARAQAKKIEERAALMAMQPNATEYDRLLAANKGRPSRASQNEQRFSKRLELMKRMQDAQITPQLQLIAAQKALDPMQQAHANMFNAQANAYNQMGAPPPGAPAAEQPQLPPGARQIAPGVIRHEPSKESALLRQYPEWMKKLGQFGGMIGNAQFGGMGAMGPQTGQAINGMIPNPGF